MTDAPLAIRSAVVSAAVAEIGGYDREKVNGYWRDVLPEGEYQDGLNQAWCGAFALRCLHKAGIALDKRWRWGMGFLLVPPNPLHVTASPQPGDIGYQANPFQHHFIVEFVVGGVVHSIDGNQPDVRRQHRTISSKLAFFSIETLLPPSEPIPATTRETIYFGSEGPDVEEWQKVLGLAGYPRVVDGKFGPQTLMYTKLYQAKMGLTVDGVVGARTWASAASIVLLST